MPRLYCHDRQRQLTHHRGDRATPYPASSCGQAHRAGQGRARQGRAGQAPSERASERVCVCVCVFVVVRVLCSVIICTPAQDARAAGDKGAPGRNTVPVCIQYRTVPCTAREVPVGNKWYAISGDAPSSHSNPTRTRMRTLPTSCRQTTVVTPVRSIGRFGLWVATVIQG
jgi:hypothetical protein